jgi:hypothetical protein
MKKLIFFAFVFATIAAQGQVKPNQFTLEPNPSNANFEVYSQKNGVNRRATLYDLRRYFAPRIKEAAIWYVPTEVGNSPADYGQFVIDPNGDTWYIDMTGRAYSIFMASTVTGLDSAYLSTDTLVLSTPAGSYVIPLGSINTDAQTLALEDSTTFVVVGISNGNAIVLKEGSNINLGVSGDTITVTASGGSGEEIPD